MGWIIVVRPEFEKIDEYHFVILSSRSLDRWVSSDIVRTWENAFVKLDPLSEIRIIDKKYNLLRKVLRNHYILSNKFAKWSFRKIQKILNEEINDRILFLIGMNYRYLDFLGFYKTKKLKIAYIIDAWENEIKSLAEEILRTKVDIILLAYQDSIELLEKHLPVEIMKRVFLFPVFIDPDIYPKDIPNKLYDIIQVGRRNDTLHQWALRYSLERHRSYLYQKKNSKGIYYFEGREWEGSNFQLSYLSLIDTLAKTKIALVSPPNLTNDKRTGKVSPLTLRYLESAMCFAIPVGFTPSSSEYREFFPETFTIVPRNYNDFADICDRLINNDNVRLELAIRNHKYVLENHSVYSRYKQLQRVLKKYDV
jgi:glycosyltransferase involved in cell wall biosynthesis